MDNDNERIVFDPNDPTLLFVSREQTVAFLSAELCDDLEREAAGLSTKRSIVPQISQLTGIRAHSAKEMLPLFKKYLNDKGMLQ